MNFIPWKLQGLWIGLRKKEFQTFAGITTPRKHFFFVFYFNVKIAFLGENIGIIYSLLCIISSSKVKER